MPVLQERLDDASYAALDWVSLVGEEGDGSAPWRLATKFFQQARHLEGEGQPLQSQAMQVLGGAISMHLRHPSHAPFGPVFQSREGRSMSMEDLGEHDVALLGQAARDAPSPWLRARLSDLAVTADGSTPPDWRLGRLAVDAYLEYVASVFGTEHAIRGLDELQRSLVLLWVYAKKDHALWDRYWAVILDEIPHSIEKNWPGLTFRLCDEAINRNRQACEVIFPQIEAKALALEAEVPQEAARWHAQAHRLNQRLGKRKEASASLMAQGEAMARAAELAAEHQPMLGPMHMTEAISLLRKAKAAPSRIQELRDRLATYERASLDHYGHISTKADVSDWVKWIDEQLAAPDFFSALLRMAYRAGQWLDVEEVEERVRTNFAKHPLSSLFTTTHVNADGMVVSQRPPLDPNDPASVRLYAISDVRQTDIPMRSSIMVSRAADTLYTAYQPSFHAVKEIVEASVITPPGHAETIARGLFSGFIDDWLAASVYLIPAMESFVRAQLKRSGAHTTGMNEDGTQHEKTLGELLEMPEAECFFGKNLVFELRVLLTEPEGFNLRNAYCHGLMPDRELQNAGIMSLWWTLWRMILFPWHDHPAVLANLPPTTS
ncbi:DUF4209 domain-containing protein [Pseudoxanthomonas mexicana]